MGLRVQVEGLGLSTAMGGLKAFRAKVKSTQVRDHLVIRQICGLFFNMAKHL